MKALFFSFFLLFALLIFGQTTPVKSKLATTPSQNMSVVYSSEAKCLLSEAEMFKAIYSKIIYSSEAKNAKINDKVIIGFDVNFDNTPINFTILNSVGYNIENNIIEVIKKLPFEAAETNGVKVRQSIVLSVPIHTSPEIQTH